ncbi:MAG: cation transporter [Planctomycetaceae bacterium]|nr:cation transporter [Planctomycetaceae bacterium]
MNRDAERERLYGEAARAALLGFVGNLMLAIVKLTGGLISRSFALLSDALNSVGDVLTSAVVLVSLYVARQPADEEHPYGHTRAEAIAGSNVALLVVLSALGIGWEAFQQFSSEHEAPPAWTLWIAGVNVVVKEALYRYKIGVGRRTGSTAIIANAWDHRSDALCSAAVLVGLAAVRFGGPAWRGADEAAALVVVAAIIWSGVGLFRQCSSELLDAQAEPEVVAAVRSAAERVPGVSGVEKLWLRKSGLEYFADIHLEVPGQTTVDEGHRIGHLVKDRVMEQFPMLRDVLVHLEPYPHIHSPGPADAMPHGDARRGTGEGAANS